jgi:hypothetical protein
MQGVKIMNKCVQSKSNEKHDICCKPAYESIIALKIFDQCRLKECINVGPVLSAEKCTCVILQLDEDNPFGRVILPDKPIYMPELISKVKIIRDSFTTKKIEVTKIMPSVVKPGFWDIEVQFTFIFKLQLFDVNMKMLKILCCKPDCQSLEECKDAKNYIWGWISYVKKITLFGSISETTLIASDLLPQKETPIENLPHVLVDSKAYFIDATLKSPYEACHFEELFDDIYDEPIIYVYVTIGLFMIIKLFRLASILIESKGYSIPKPCSNPIQNDCELFSQMVFSAADFLPASEIVNIKE